MVSEEAFLQSLRGPKDDWSAWAKGRSPHLFRIFRSLEKLQDVLCGPTLDVASGGAIWFRALRDFLPRTLPYQITELQAGELIVDGTTIKQSKFECERDLLPYPDNSFGLILFCDVIEHLLVDPMWTLLEFNRVLRRGGHLVISTPNACGADRLLKILQGFNPASENEYKPMALYQRHNREWTAKELVGVLLCAGMTATEVSTNPQLMTELQVSFLSLARQVNITNIENLYFGPEIVAIAEKTEEVSLNSALPSERRWPDWLYSTHENYHRRPKQFPIIVSDDYA